jgi:hypothetical protein
MDVVLLGLYREAIMAGIASAAQGLDFSIAVELYHGHGLNRYFLSPVIVWVVYRLGHYEDWVGYEVAGLTLFQLVLLFLGSCLIHGDLTLAICVLCPIVFGLVIIAAFVRTL